MVSLFSTFSIYSSTAAAEVVLAAVVVMDISDSHRSYCQYLPGVPLLV